jgi:two-component system, NtrC family, response regulator PilR
MTMERRHQPSDRRRPVLIVSANPDTVDLYVISLRSERMPALSVSSADDALSLLRDRAVSAVVVDVTHPVNDWEACRAMRAAAEPGLPLVVLTGWIDQKARQEAIRVGCTAFVAKPASPERLREILQRTRAGERGIVALE